MNTSSTITSENLFMDTTDSDEEIKILRKRCLEDREEREHQGGWRRRDNIFKEVFIYTFEKYPQRFYLEEVKIEDPVKLLKLETVKRGCKINLEDMVLMWAGHVFEDTDDLIPLLTSTYPGWCCMGRMSFIMYEMRFIELVNKNDFDGIQKYFKEIELSQSFINENQFNRSDMGFSHLEVAATCSNSTIVKALCDYGQFRIHVAKFMNDSLSLSHFAASVNNKEVIEVLGANGYCHELKDVFGRTPLMYSCINGHRETTKYLIDAGCNVNVRANNGISAIGCAIDRKHTEIVEMLIGAGADAEEVKGVDLKVLTDQSVVMNAESTAEVGLIKDNLDEEYL